MRYSRNHLNFTCFWAARDGKPSCAEWLDGRSNVEPDHMCFAVTQASTEWFASERLVHSAVEHDWLCGTWPFPLGIQAYLDWHAERVAWGWSDLLPEPCWPTPLVSQSDAWLGLAGRRATDAGVVWLLGLVTRVDEPDLTYTNRVSVSKIGKDDVLHVRKLYTAHPNIVRVYEARNGGAPHERQDDWRWADPAILIEGHIHTPGDLDALTAAVRPLLDWYNRTLLGKTFRTGGPPPLFTTQDQCRTAVVNECRALLRGNPRPTRLLVAQRLNLSESGLKKALARFGLKWKDLVAEARAK